MNRFNVLIARIGLSRDLNSKVFFLNRGRYEVFSFLNESNKGIVNL